MKKFSLVLIILLFSSSLFALSFGYTLDGYGESTFSDSTGGLKVSLALSFDKDRHIGDLGADVVFGFNSQFFEGVDLHISSPLTLTADHIFKNFFINKVYWAPSVKVGSSWRMGDDGVRVLFSLLPFRFIDTHFIYEFLSPYILIRNGIEGWGFTIMKFTAFIGG